EVSQHCRLLFCDCECSPAFGRPDDRSAARVLSTKRMRCYKPLLNSTKEKRVQRGLPHCPACAGLYDGHSKCVYDFAKRDKKRRFRSEQRRLRNRRALYECPPRSLNILVIADDAVPAAERLKN